MPSLGIIKKSTMVFLFLGICPLTLSAEIPKNFLLPDEICACYGKKGKPEKLSGFALGLNWDWPGFLVLGKVVKIRGYWQGMTAYWEINRAFIQYSYKRLGAFSFSPILRLESTKEHTLSSVHPFWEIGVGPAFLTNSQIGHRNLGAKLAFHDRIGVGLSFGKTAPIEVSYQYFHYSNAGYFSPNQGIDVKMLIQLGLRFN